MSPSYIADTYLEIMLANSVVGSEQYLMLMSIKNQIDEAKKKIGGNK